jgi:hypothetical protein
LTCPGGTAKKAAKKSDKVLGKKELKRTKGGFMSEFQTGGSAVKLTGGTITGNLSNGNNSAISGNNTINGGTLIGL